MSFRGQRQIGNLNSIFKVSDSWKARFRKLKLFQEKLLLVISSYEVRN